MQHFFPAYRITISDLPRVKAVAARVFGRDVPTQTRLEIIARGAGFKTYASFLATLHKEPILLNGDQAREERYIADSVPKSVSPPFYKGVSLTDLVAAGLAWPERLDVREAVQRTPAEKLANLKSSAGTDNDFLHFMWPMRTKDRTRNVYMSSIPPAEAQARFSTQLVVVASPSNQRTYTNDSTERTWLLAKGQHTLGTEAWPEQGKGQPLPSIARHDLQALLGNARVRLFDAQDLADFRQELDRLGLSALNLHMEILKPMMLEIQRRKDGTFSQMATEACLDDPHEGDGEQEPGGIETKAIQGMFDMAGYVMGVAYERHRMQTGAKESDDTRFYFDPLLIGVC